MLYESSRGGVAGVSSAEAILRGIAPDGGLFVPQSVPELDLTGLVGCDYTQTAKAVLRLYLTDYTEDELDKCVQSAYNGRFDSHTPAPLTPLSDRLHILELFHGPTNAFKDMALQLLPHLMSLAEKKAGNGSDILILTATSGDTGKAALEGFRDVPGVKIAVFYPKGGVSPMQKRQMTTQEGGNVAVSAVEGNFDDAQTGVKRIFTSPAFAEALKKRGWVCSSANSINWGRLVPQIVYYVFAYTSLVRQGRIKQGQKVNFAVPTGNFGNILAAWYAREMGLPINRIVCASNRNRILTDFLRTGVYDRNREFFTTHSPSMDILISSNLERLLYELGGSSEKVRGWMEGLSETGRYGVDSALKSRLDSLFWAGCCDDSETVDSIKDVYERFGYLSDPHTAVGVKVCEDYARASGDKTVTVAVSTASPFKFAKAVLLALDPAFSSDDDFLTCERLSRISGNAIPAPLAELKEKPVRFAGCVSKDGLWEFIEGFLP
ncbi:MAG: threonine synthase [Oscillospiraceae bacterium]|jgi:threonine synthase|nr:threonine synthase [Oscillospiraceae bacterium]